MQREGAVEQRIYRKAAEYEDDEGDDVDRAARKKEEQ